jgi:hypothetical protein
MFYRIAISFAAVTIGMSCIATDALARGGGGGGGGGGKGGGNTVTTGVRGPHWINHRAGGVGGPTASGVGDPTGGGAAAGGRYYAPALYDSNTACGRYPYPPCKNVPTR